MQQSCTQHFNIHDATKLQATVACNFVASCMVGFSIDIGPKLRGVTVILVMGKFTKSRKKNNKQKQPPTFTKVKKKVGKKQIPTNVTRVDFKSRQIHFPSQLISMQDSATRIHSYISQLTHHNAHTRVRALSSLHQLASKEHELVRKYLAHLVYKLEPLFTDACVEIQKQLQTFLALLFKLFPSDHFKPYISLLVAYLIASLTHTDSTVQYTAFSIGRDLVESFPREISHHVSSILPRYLDILTGTSLHNSRVQKYPTFSQLVAPRISTRVLAVSNTLDHTMLIFENIKLMSSLLVQKTATKSTPNTTQNNKFIAYIAPRLMNAADKHIRIDTSIVLFFTSYLSTSWSHIQELHNSLSHTSLNTQRAEYVIRAFSAIIDTYILIPQILTTVVLEGVESSLVEEYFTQEDSWTIEFYQFFSEQFPIETSNSALIHSLQCVNSRILDLYISMHIFAKPDSPLDKNKIIEFVDGLSLSSGDVTSLISKLKIFLLCNQTDCGCSHLIQVISRNIWDFLQQSDKIEEKLNFVVLLMDYYLELTSSELLQSFDVIIKHLPSLVQNEMIEDTACNMVNSLSRMFNLSCLPPTVSSYRNTILISLLTNLSNYSSQLQNSIISLSFFSDTDDTEFLYLLGNKVLTNFSTEKSISLLDVLFHSFQTHRNSSVNFTNFITNLSTNTLHGGISQLDITPLALRATCYLRQIPGYLISQPTDS